MKIFIICICCFLSAHLYADDQEELKILDQSYANAWKAGDNKAVLSLFTTDAVLIPHHGDQPIVGKEAIQDFWFNPKYPPTLVPEWNRVPYEIIINGDVGIVRGRSKLVWEYDGVRTTIPEQNYVLIAFKKDNQWKIKWLTWNDDPRKWIQEKLQ